MTGYPSRSVLFAATAWSVLIIFGMLKVYDYGNSSVMPHMVDWAHHAALAETLRADLGRSPTAIHLAEMAVYPDGSHWIAALLARAQGVSIFQSLQLCALAFALLGASVLSWRYALAMSRPENPPTAVLAAIGCLALATASQLDVVGLIRPNAFYAQLVGMSLALLFHWATLRLQRPAALILAGICGTWILEYVHLTPALWFAGATGLMLLARRSTWTKVLSLAGLYGLGLLAILLTNPATRMMIFLAQGDGDFLWGFGRNLPLWAVTATLLAIAVLCALAVRSWKKRGLNWQHLLLHTHSGLVAACVLCATQLALLYLFDKGSPYSAKKFLYFITMELPILVCSVAPGLGAASGGSPTVSPGNNTACACGRRPAGMFLAALTLVTVMQVLRLLPPLTNVNPHLAFLQNRLEARGPVPAGQEPEYPWFPWLSPVENYALATTVLRLHRDATEDMLQGLDPAKKKVIPPDSLLPAPELWLYALSGSSVRREGKELCVSADVALCYPQAFSIPSTWPHRPMDVILACEYAAPGGGRATKTGFLRPSGGSSLLYSGECRIPAPDNASPVRIGLFMEGHGWLTNQYGQLTHEIPLPSALSQGTQ